MSALASVLRWILWRNLLTVVDRWIRCRRKRRPAGTTLEAKESLPMRERSSLLVADRFSNQHLMIAVISCNLARGSRSCRRLESSTIPRTVKLVAGPSDFSLATGMPSFWQTCSMVTWSLDRWAVQVDRAGGSHPGSAGG